MKNSRFGSEHVAVAVPRRGRSMRRRVPGLPERSRCLIMGIVNVTADSFSDGGRFEQAEKAVEHGLKLAADGADLIDIGGESTRPGAGRVPVEVEFERVVPVVRELADAGLLVSIDTTRAVVADAAIRAGACVVNDVSSGLADSSMARCVADAAVPYIAMHWRAPSAVMHRYSCYEDVVVEVANELARRVDALVAAGVNIDRIVVDPGLGFAKQFHHNWQILCRLGELCRMGPPLLIGASRKSFLRSPRLGGGFVPTLDALDSATAAVSALAERTGVFGVRVHNVASSLRAVERAHVSPSEPIDVSAPGCCGPLISPAASRRTRCSPAPDLF